ncbi:MAG: hypothetical protein KA198_08260 [Chitinophagaceae bacterium]|nr:hypothetical protein [Chitinophagaceae bacterium]
MEFRIAPIIIACFNLIFILFMNPMINESISLKTAASYPTVLLPFGLLMILSLGTFLRHTFYSVAFKTSFYLITAINLGLVAFYIYTIQQQHL